MLFNEKERCQCSTAFSLECTYHCPDKEIVQRGKIVLLWRKVIARGSWRGGGGGYKSHFPAQIFPKSHFPAWFLAKSQSQQWNFREIPVHGKSKLNIACMCSECARFQTGLFLVCLVALRTKRHGNWTLSVYGTSEYVRYIWALYK